MLVMSRPSTINVKVVTLNGPYFSVSHTTVEELFYSEVLISRSEGIRTKHVVENRLLNQLKEGMVWPLVYWVKDTKKKYRQTQKACGLYSYLLHRSTEILGLSIM